MHEPDPRGVQQISTLIPSPKPLVSSPDHRQPIEGRFLQTLHVQEGNFDERRRIGEDHSTAQRSIRKSGIARKTPSSRRPKQP
jgi:hypothetical protein